MSADDSTARSLKRARLSPAREDSSSRPASSSVVPLTNLECHPEFWFDDGNIVLVTPKSMGFRIFRGLLAAQSTVFADMFASSSASADETFDGCPVVHVTDSHHDLVYLFRVLLPTSSHIKYHPESDPKSDPSFDEIAAVIRLAHKYHIPPVEEQALHTLQAHYFPRDSHVYCNIASQETQPIQCITAVNLARLTDTPHILPSALYACCYLGGKLLDSRTHEDGTIEHLSTDDLRRCFDARIALDRELALLPSRIFATVQPDRCNEPGKRCSPHIVALASNPILVRAIMSRGPLGDRSGWIQALLLNAVCEGCAQVLLERERAERERIWDCLPHILGIGTVEGWAKPGDGGVQGCTCTVMYFHPAMPKKPSSQAPAQICAPHLTKLFIGGNCTSLKQLFTARDAPLLQSASVHALWDGPLRTMADGYIDYVSCIEALATVSSPATLTDLSIELEEDGRPRICEHIANVLGPLIVFANMERLCLSCPILSLVADDEDFWEVTGAWPRLREFSLAHASWASESHLDPDDDSEESESEDNPTPTPQILECFREDCPDLRVLRLPHIDVHAGVPGLFTRVPRGKGRAQGHGLAQLWFGAQDLYERMMRGPMEPELGAEKVVEWARYILHLFPSLDAEESLKRCQWSDTAVGWIEVFERVRDFGNLSPTQEGCSSGGTVSKSLRS